jgi:hypothetical protein
VLDIDRQKIPQLLCIEEHAMSVRPPETSLHLFICAHATGRITINISITACLYMTAHENASGVSVSVVCPCVSGARLMLLPIHVLVQLPERIHIGSVRCLSRSAEPASSQVRGSGRSGLFSAVESRPRRGRVPRPEVARRLG